MLNRFCNESLQKDDNERGLPGLGIDALLYMLNKKGFIILMFKYSQYI